MQKALWYLLGIPACVATHVDVTSPGFHGTLLSGKLGIRKEKWFSMLSMERGSHCGLCLNQEMPNLLSLGDLWESGLLQDCHCLPGLVFMCDADGCCIMESQTDLG